MKPSLSIHLLTAAHALTTAALVTFSGVAAADEPPGAPPPADAYPPPAYPPPAYPPPAYPPPGATQAPPPGYAPQPSYMLVAPPGQEPMVRRSVPMMAVGGTLIGLGSASILVGMVGMSFSAIGDCFDDCRRDLTIPSAFLVGGIAGLAVGIPLLVYGKKLVPISSTAQAGVRSLPAWAGAPGGPGWKWQF